MGTPRRSTKRIEKASAALSVLRRRLVHPTRLRRGGDGAAEVGKGAGSPRARLRALQALFTPQGTSAGIRGEGCGIYEDDVILSDGKTDKYKKPANSLRKLFDSSLIMFGGKDAEPFIHESKRKTLLKFVKHQSILQFCINFFAA